MNGPLALLVRRSLVKNRRAVLGLALVIALAGGVALTSIAGARRTASAFPRYLEASNASDVALNPVSDDDGGGGGADAGIDTTLAFAERARRLPEVADDATYIGLEGLFLLDDRGEPVEVQPEVVGSLDGRFVDQDRLVVLEGRLPRPDHEDEVAVNRAGAAAADLVVGSRVRLAVPDLSGGADVDLQEVTMLDELTVRVVGVGLFPEEVLSDDYDGTPRVLATPALTARVQDVAGGYFWQGLRLSPGTSVDEGIRAYESILDEGFQVNVQRTDTQVDRVQRSVRPIAVALGVFGVAATLATLALGGLGAVRLLTAAGTAESRALRAVGVSRRDRVLIAAAPPVIATVAGAIGAVVLAVAFSPRFPIGAVRVAEPDRGVDLDATVVLLGGAGIAFVIGLVALLAARRAVSSSVTASLATPRPSWLVGRIAAAGLGPVAVVGAGHALGGEGRRDGVPTRSTLVACVVAVVAVASALTFGASVGSLLDTPSSYGWTADLAVHSGGGYDFLDPERAEAAADSPGIEGFTLAGFASLSVGDDEVNGVGFLPVEGDPLITVVEGRLPRDGTEVALGADTARDLGVEVGSEIDEASRPLRVVGIVALPAIGPAASAHPSLGQGALMTLEGLGAANANTYPTLALLRVADDVDLDGEERRIVADVATAMSEYPPEVAAAYASGYQDLRPSEVVGLAPASRTANLLAGLLGAASVLALGLTLSASVRRRQRTYAVLAAIGLDRGDLRQTVRWQLNLVTFMALAIGLPIGVALGRVAWMAFADQLGAQGDPRVPIALLAATAAGLLVVANLLGEWPARTAGRRALASALRD